MHKQLLINTRHKSCLIGIIHTISYVLTSHVHKCITYMHGQSHVHTKSSVDRDKYHLKVQIQQQEHNQIHSTSAC